MTKTLARRLKRIDEALPVCPTCGKRLHCASCTPAADRLHHEIHAEIVKMLEEWAKGPNGFELFEIVDEVRRGKAGASG
jgi:hypothetical protein